ncbi:hypothetical protein QBC33DRAFT_500132 [Phialemonium atrogriseum]|uniref:DUF8021 domain-containing protein n=1 Tax=Phialemonium atrogriseum TaxID=1093897 RepID=A0AAJ0BR95_9PEZI|nr:uncharacterized protein QBC33DRAFT_500132 [Phialemonium atrogriseum]KAK1763010.1 hypothetical protein QBC33DRAFT_500132 [Phialemonium atrogriseum]
MIHSFFVVAALASGVVADCTRAALQESADRYLESQSTGELQSIFAADTVVYEENNKVTDIKTSILKQPLKIDHNHTILDTTACAAYLELIITDARNPHVIGTQIRHNTTADGSSLAVTKIDSIVSTTGDWQFNATKSLSYILQEDWSAPAAPDSRATLQAAADAYLDLWGNSDAPVPWGTPCERMEGSSYTGSGSATDSCNVGIPTGADVLPVTGRRYVVDEEMGAVNVLCTMSVMGNAPDSHEFRLVGGKLRYVHTITIMRRAKKRVPA